MATTEFRLRVSVRSWVVPLLCLLRLGAAAGTPFGLEVDQERLGAFILRFGVKVAAV